MQTFTAQPLTNQTKDNPYSNPLLLATLIIPHLETYLMAHTSVRFLLLEYPAEHLATVLALQKLVGVDIIKVAGVVDAADGPPESFSRRNGQAMQPLVQGLDSLAACKDLTFAKANLLLTSAATKAEMATFVSTIGKILLDISQFYVPEPEPQPPRTSPVSRRDNTTNTSPSPSPSRSHTPAQYSTLPTVRPPPPPSFTGLTSPPLSPVPYPPRPASPAPSTRSRFSIRSGRSHKRGARTKVESVLGDLGPDDDDDNEFDPEERRLMGLFTQRRDMRKGNSRKALKLLGLA